ncbi:hypothetical protein HN51_037082, partial [Arachis hypogaea]
SLRDLSRTSWLKSSNISSLCDQDSDLFHFGHNLLPSMQATDKNFVVIVAILGLVLFALLISNMQ